MTESKKPVKGKGVSHSFVEQLERFAVHLLPPAAVHVEYETPCWVALYTFGQAVLELYPKAESARRLNLQHDTIVLVEPGVAIRLSDEMPTEWLQLSIKPEHLAAAAERASLDGDAWTVPCASPIADPGVAAVCHEMRRVVLAGPVCEPGYLGALADALVARLVALSRHGDDAPGASESLSPYKLRTALRLIEECLDQNSSVERLAEAVGLSRAHFSRAFKKSTGETPARFIMRRRVVRARELLSDPLLSLAEIAQLTGFSSQAHFTAAFKNDMQVTPGRYREALLGAR
ncbi:AraC family transcriptional regulator [Ramlibacter sp. 2FC]|uniref:helix-turn-helix transcriptional regulator n=1 Tax=Ramlibacter sp. 2FC TaxID=2502188 RepID=UPI0010F6A02F|nr:AraC family transcriptional regulator [Ramlibacter sp. 2FC]